MITFSDIMKEKLPVRTLKPLTKEEARAAIDEIIKNAFRPEPIIVSKEVYDALKNTPVAQNGHAESE